MPIQGTAPANLSLADVNNRAAGGEVVGPLVQMGNDGQQTVFTFDERQAAPVKDVVITQDNGGNPDVAAGSTQICRGTIFVSGNLTACTASRPN